jgi:alkylation response protein AidB-like acyl-CoA dehydrogenase
MTTSLSQIEADVVEALSCFLAKEAPLPRNIAAAQSPAGFDRQILERLASLGLFGLSNSIEAGGLGLTSRLAGSCCAEAGRVLLGGPWLELLLAARLLERAGATGALEDVITGSLLVSMPLASSVWLRPPEVLATGEHARFAGGSCEVGFADGVGEWLVPARDTASGALLLVRVPAAPDRAVPRRGFSVLSRSSDVELADAEGTVLAGLDDRLVEAHLLDVARLLSCVSVGATREVLAAAVGYAKQREQFSRPIGSFQALQHRLADVFIDLEHTQNLVSAALDPVPPEEVRVLSAMAKVASDRLAVTSAETALQVHGGLGFTWELPVHHYLKEALRRRALPQPTAAYRQGLRELVLSYRI